MNMAVAQYRSTPKYNPRSHSLPVMPFTDKSPASWLGAGYIANPTNIVLTNRASTNPVPLLTSLDATESDETTGDIRRTLYGIVRGIFDKVYDKNQSLDAADRPAKMTLTRSSYVDDVQNTITKSYTFSFILSVGEAEVADE